MPAPLIHSQIPLWCPFGAEQAFEGVPISNAIQYGHLAACSGEYLSVATGISGGGTVALLELKKPGRYSGDTYYRAQCHSNSVTDMAWQKDVLATASLDKTVKLWRAGTTHGASSASLELVDVLEHRDRVVNITWSHRDSHLLATALYGKKVYVWNAGAGRIHSAHIGSVGGHSLCWSPDGRRLATASRDKRLCIFDVERGEKRPVISTVCHQGSKPWKVAFLDASTMVTVGFGLEGSKEVALWDLGKPEQPLERVRCNQSSGSVIMAYYPGSRFLFLSGRGDNGIQAYRYENRSMNLVGHFQSPHPYRDICWVPSPYLDTKNHEVGRCFRLFQPDTAVVLSTGSCRRNNLVSVNLYQQDFGAPFGLSRGGSGQTCRKLSTPLIEPLSVRLQESRIDEDDEEETEDEEEAELRAIGTLKPAPPITSQRSLRGVPQILQRMRSDTSGEGRMRQSGCGEYVNLQYGFRSMREKKKGRRKAEELAAAAAEEEEERPPPVPPRSKAMRQKLWSTWRVLPETIQEKIKSRSRGEKRKVENEWEAGAVSLQATALEYEEVTVERVETGRTSDDEILFMTSKFSQNRCRHQEKIDEPMKSKRSSNHQPEAPPTIRKEEEEEQATCSVSDLVAAFEAKAARIAAAQETASICSGISLVLDTATQPLSPLIIPDVAPASAQTLVEPVVSKQQQQQQQLNTLKPCRCKSPQVMNSPSQTRSAPSQHLYADSRPQRWSISHPPPASGQPHPSASSGAYRSPALRYMQRGHPRSPALKSSTTTIPTNSAVSLNPSGLIVGSVAALSPSGSALSSSSLLSTVGASSAVSLSPAGSIDKSCATVTAQPLKRSPLLVILPTHEDDDQSAGMSGTILKGVLLRKKSNEGQRSNQDWRKGLCLEAEDYASNRCEHPSQDHHNQGYSITNMQVDNERLCEQLFNFLEKDSSESPTLPSLKSTLRQKISGKKKALKSKEKSDHALAKDAAKVPPTTIEANDGSQTELKVDYKEEDLNERPVQLNPPTIRANPLGYLTHTYPEMSPVRPIPVNLSRLSLLDEFRLMRAQKKAKDVSKPPNLSTPHTPLTDGLLSELQKDNSQKMDRQKSFTLQSADPSKELFTSLYEHNMRKHSAKSSLPEDFGQAQQHGEQTGMETILSRPVRALPESYLAYYRDLEATIRRCSGVLGAEGTSSSVEDDPDTVTANCLTHSKLETSGLQSGKKATPDEEPNSDCDETCTGASTDADSDVLTSSIYLTAKT